MNSSAVPPLHSNVSLCTHTHIHTRVGDYTELSGSAVRGRKTERWTVVFGGAEGCVSVGHGGYLAGVRALFKRERVPFFVSHQKTTSQTQWEGLEDEGESKATQPHLLLHSPTTCCYPHPPPLPLSAWQSTHINTCKNSFPKLITASWLFLIGGLCSGVCTI